MKKLGLIDKAFLLKRTPLFMNIDLDLILTCADKVGVLSFDPKETIFDIGEEAHRMFFLAKGSVIVSDGKQTKELSQSDFFGEESLFNEKPRSYKAEAVTDTLLLTLSKTNLLTIISESPSVAVGLLQVYTSKNRFFE